MKKIIISTYDSVFNPYYNGGGATAIHELVRKLLNDFDITILTSSIKHKKPTTKDGVKYVFINVGAFGSRIGQLSFSLALPFYARHLVYDLWVENLTPPFSASLLSLFIPKTINLIGLVHMLSGEDMERKYHLPFKSIERFGLKLYKNFIVTTDLVKNKILESNPKAFIDVIPNAINITKSTLITPPKKHFLFLGRLEKDQKGLDLLLEAYSKIPVIQRKNLLIAGNGSTTTINWLYQKSMDLGIYDQVKLLGRINNQQKNLLISQAYCVAITSRYETFSLVALESLALKTPVVCFDIDGLRWLPRDCSFKANPFDVDDFAKHMLQTLSPSSPQVSQLIKHGYAHSREYGWSKVLNKYSEYFHNLLGHPPKDINLKNKLFKSSSKILFISPHLDDAIFSAGALIYGLKDKDIEVINIFTQGGNKPYTRSASAYVKQCNYKNINTLYKVRISEDKQIFKSIGIKSHYLGFTDCLWRIDQNKSRNPILSMLGKILPELIHVYPTYKFHAGIGKISQGDKELEDAIYVKLSKIIGDDKNVIVICPQGIGNHVDHLIVKRACSKLNCRKIYWADFPYSVEDGNETQLSYSNYVYKSHLDEKIRLSSMYGTQISAIFPTGIIPEIPEYYRSSSSL